MHALHDLSTTAIRIVIDLDAGSDPIEGTLIEPELHASVFRGWLALTALLEAIRTDDTPTSRPPHRS